MRSPIHIRVLAKLPCEIRNLQHLSGKNLKSAQVSFSSQKNQSRTQDTQINAPTPNTHHTPKQKPQIPSPETPQPTEIDTNTEATQKMLDPESYCYVKELKENWRN